MPRVKRGMLHLKKRKNLLKKTKGYQGNRRTKLRSARVAFLKAGVNAYRDRRLKKRTMRQLWSVRLNAAARLNGTTYSKLIDALKKANIEIDRKVLSTIAAKFPVVFTKIVEATRSGK